MSIFGSGYQAFAAAQTMGQQINSKIADTNAQVQQRQQSVEMGKMEIAEKQQKMAAQKQFMDRASGIISEHDKNLQSSLAAGGVAPDKEAEQRFSEQIKMYSDLAKVAPSPAEQESYFKLADAASGKLQSAKKTNLEIEDKRQKEMSSFAGTALDDSATPQQAFDYVKDKVGLKAAMEMPTDPAEYKKYWKQKQGMGQTANERLTSEFKVKTDAEIRANQAEHLKLEKTRVGISEQQLAISRNAALSKTELAAQKRLNTKPVTIDVGGKKYEFDPDNKATGPRLETDTRYALLGDSKAPGGGAGDKIMQRQVVGAVNAANELARGIDQIREFGASQTSGTFAHMKDGQDILSSLAANGGNKATTQDQQMYATTMKGFGLEFAQLMTVSYGRGATNAIIGEFNKMVEGRPGDTQATLMFKMANAADVIKTRLAAVPDSNDPKIQKVREEAIAKLNKLPSPASVLAASKTKGAIDQSTVKNVVSMGQALDKLKGKEVASEEPAKPSFSEKTQSYFKPTSAPASPKGPSPSNPRIDPEWQHNADRNSITILQQELANTTDPKDQEMLKRDIANRTKKLLGKYN